ncbi:MAG: amino acid adenylation domain protein, partial [Verrucomicrobiales bacterium]|nr:amino acid adenylation domain protein [Verrucomicrobiales bacterium]
MTLPDLTRLPLAQKRAILAALGKAKSSTVAPILSKNGSTHLPVGNIRKKAMDFSLLFFSEECSESEQDRYYLVRECAQFADKNGFKAIWVPERHFHRFGAIYPNPAVLAAALASITRNIRLRAGSVVLPLEDPLRVVEAWAMVDNLSGGRVDISFASGWNPNDFVLSPETFARTKEVLSERIQEVRHLWRGGTVQRKNGKGEAVEIRAFPSPIQTELDTWFTAAGNPKTFDEAGRLGCNLLTMLFSSSLEELSQKIQSYRLSWERGNNVGEGCVTLMLHSFLDKSPDVVQEKVRAPFLKYIRSSLDVQRLGQAAQWDEKQLNQMAEFAYERYYRTGALFGTPESCFNLVNTASESGVNEIACQLDFGIDAESVLRSLPYLKNLKEKYELSLTPVSIQNPGWKDGS